MTDQTIIGCATCGQHPVIDGALLCRKCWRRFYKVLDTIRAMQGDTDKYCEIHRKAWWGVNLPLLRYYTPYVEAQHGAVNYWRLTRAGKAFMALMEEKAERERRRELDRQLRKGQVL